MRKRDINSASRQGIPNMTVRRDKISYSEQLATDRCWEIQNNGTCNVGNRKFGSLLLLLEADRKPASCNLKTIRFDRSISIHQSSAPI